MFAYLEQYIYFTGIWFMFAIIIKYNKRNRAYSVWKAFKFKYYCLANHVNVTYLRPIATYLQLLVTSISFQASNATA